MSARLRHAAALGGAVLVAGSLAIAACTDFNGLTFPLDAAPFDDGFVASRDSGPRDATSDARGTPEGGAATAASDAASTCSLPHLYSFHGHCYRFTDVEAGALDF